MRSSGLGCGFPLRQRNGRKRRSIRIGAMAGRGAYIVGRVFTMGCSPEEIVPLSTRTSCRKLLEVSSSHLFFANTMPRLVSDALAIFLRVGEVKSEFFGMLFQPPKFTGTGERSLECEMIRRTELERAPRMVRRCNRAQCSPGNHGWKVSDQPCRT